MKNFLKDNWFKIIIAFSILIVAVSIGYYFIIYIPKINADKLAEQKAQQRLEANTKLTNQTNLQDCLDQAATDSSTQWDKNCSTRGLKNDCSLPMDVSDSIGKAEVNQKNDCFKQYPQ
jgi:predicted membrane protein